MPTNIASAVRELSHRSHRGFTIMSRQITIMVKRGGGRTVGKSTAVPAVLLILALGVGGFLPAAAATSNSGRSRDPIAHTLKQSSTTACVPPKDATCGQSAAASYATSGLPPRPHFDPAGADTPGSSPNRRPEPQRPYRGRLSSTLLPSARSHDPAHGRHGDGAADQN